ncbi:Uncharacterised protein [Salmonella enterica subsp. enterica]|uniref:Uncharacterized protein n=1 Tax=Salmonella enterica I TaxID=59201 RepID=A0A379VX81_SALET|nr:Uncharacterised protein [Salmonella enterica subsp. enterica]
MALVGINNENEFTPTTIWAKSLPAIFAMFWSPGLSRKMPLAKLNALP